MAVGKLALPAGGSSGSSGLQLNAKLSGAGTQFTTPAAITSRTESLAGYGRGSVENHTFVKLTASAGYNQYVGIKSNGTLWYWRDTSTDQPWMTAYRTWTQYGTDTNWQHVVGGVRCFSYVKGGQLWFSGYGGDRQRGDGLTNDTTTPIAVNTAYTWVTSNTGHAMLSAINSDGWLFTTGYGYDYQTGLNTLNIVATLTRERTNRTDWLMAGGPWRGFHGLTTGGNLYFSGQNNYGVAGPLITTSGSINGPTLSYSGANLTFISRSNRFHAHAIDSDTKIRFAGETGNSTQKGRVDNVNTNLQYGSGFQVIDGGSTGWTFYGSQTGYGESWEWGGVAIKNGNVLVGGVASSNINFQLGATSNFQDWRTVYNTGTATAVAWGPDRVMVSCS
jgi:hypothetical protein